MTKKIMPVAAGILLFATHEIIEDRENYGVFRAVVDVDLDAVRAEWWAEAAAVAARAT
jgi:hypothetical protein